MYGTALVLHAPCREDVSCISLSCISLPSQRRQPSLERKHVAHACKAPEAATPAPVYRLSHATVPAPAVHTCIIVDVVIAGAPARALVDTGANVSFMSDEFVKSVGIACDNRNAHSASLADGTSVGITGCTPKLSVKLSSVLSKHKFLVLPNLDGMDVVLGMDYLATNDATVHLLNQPACIAPGLRSGLRRLKRPGDDPVGCGC